MSKKLQHMSAERLDNAINAKMWWKLKVQKTIITKWNFVHRQYYLHFSHTAYTDLNFVKFSHLQSEFAEDFPVRMSLRLKFSNTVLLFLYNYTAVQFSSCFIGGGTTSFSTLKHGRPCRSAAIHRSSWVQPTFNRQHRATFSGQQADSSKNK